MNGISPKYLKHKPRHPFNCSPNELKKVGVRLLAHIYQKGGDLHRLQCTHCAARWNVYMLPDRERLPHGYWHCRGKQCNCKPAYLLGGK